MSAILFFHLVRVLLVISVTLKEVVSKKAENYLIVIIDLFALGVEGNLVTATEDINYKKVIIEVNLYVPKMEDFNLVKKRIVLTVANVKRR